MTCVTTKKCIEEVGTKMSKLYVMGEFWQFLKYRKKFWLLPIVITMLLFGTLLVFAQSSAVAPFIYALF